MFALIFSLIGIALLESNFPKIRLAGIPIIYIIIICLLVSYLRFFIVMKGKIRLDKIEKSLLVFVLFGLIYTGISFLGINKFVASEDLYLMRSYIPRQAYYLFILPSVILFQDDFYIKGIDHFLLKYWKYFFWIIYFLQFIILKHFIISLSAEMILCWLLLYYEGNLSHKNTLMYIVLLITPPSGGGASTQMIIRMIFLLIVLFHYKWKKKLYDRLTIAVGSIIIATFILPLFVNKIVVFGDANAVWRLQYWHDELSQLSKSFFIGVGYGTSYASKEFVGNSLNIVGGPFGASNGYSTLDKLFVTGSHNSFIAVSFRLGIIGISLFFSFIININYSLKNSKRLLSPSTYLGFYSSIILISFNVGLESPAYLCIFVFMMGRCVLEIKKNRTPLSRIVYKRNIITKEQ